MWLSIKSLKYVLIWLYPVPRLLTWTHQDLKIVVTCSHSKINFFLRKTVYSFGIKIFPREELLLSKSSFHIHWLKPGLKSVKESVNVLELDHALALVVLSASHPWTVVFLFFFKLSLTLTSISCDLVYRILPLLQVVDISYCLNFYYNPPF